MSDGELHSEAEVGHDSPLRQTSAGTRAIGCLIVFAVGIWLLGHMGSARIAAQKSASSNNLRQIGLALYNYHDAYKQFPPDGIADSQGDLHYGWMFQIYTWLDGMTGDDVARVNRHWKDPSNVEILQLTPNVYLNPLIAKTKSDDGLGYSHYAANSRLLQPNRSLSIDEITDGPANTIMVGEVNEGFVPWGMPGNTRNPAKGLNKGPDTFGSPFEEGVHFLFADGSVRFLSTDIDPALLKALATPAGGEDLKSLVGD